MIAAKAKAAGADSYTITSARMGNFVTMSAETK
nr:YdgH/BhsA/McbA-like domain containing protein [Providencia sp. G1(2023)]